MNKKLILSVYTFLTVLFLSSQAQAGFFEKFYTVSSSGSTIEKSDFRYDNETPFLYVKLSDPGLSFKAAWWNDPSSDSYFTSEGPSANQETWLSLSNWDSVKEHGLWTINGSFLSAGAPLDSGTASYQFTVSPEPVSSALFIIGGLALGGRKFYNSRKRAEVIA